MPEVLSAMAPRRTREIRAAANDCVVQARAEIVSLGGAVLLALCLLISAMLVMALFSPSVTGVQRFIAVILFVASWAYLIDSATEQLSLVGNTVVFKAVLSRTRTIPLNELEGMLLIHQGLNLEHGIETIEFKQYGKKIDRISLGPCWQRNKLEGFLKSIEQTLRSPKLTEEVR